MGVSILIHLNKPEILQIRNYDFSGVLRLNLEIYIFVCFVVKLKITWLNPKKINSTNVTNESKKTSIIFLGCNKKYMF